MSQSASPLEIKHRPQPSESFGGWIKASSSLMVSQIALILSIVLYFATFVYYVFQGDHGTASETSTEEQFKTYSSYVFVANIVVLVLFFFYSRGLSKKKMYGQTQAKKAYELVFGRKWDKPYVEELCQEKNEAGANPRVTANNFDEAYEHMCDRGEDDTVALLKSLRHYWLFALCYYAVALFIKAYGFDNDETEFIVYHVLDAIQLGILYACYQRLLAANPNTKKSLLNHKWVPVCISFFWVCLCLLPICIGDGDSMTAVLKFKSAKIVVSAFMGVGLAVVIALIVSRLDSKFIGLPSELVLLLYGYALVQPLFNVMEAIDGMEAVVSTTIFFLVFIFKVYFFLIILYAFHTGRLLCYFTNSGRLSGLMKDVRHCQADIQEDNLYKHIKTNSKFADNQRWVFWICFCLLVSLMSWGMYEIYSYCSCDIGFSDKVDLLMGWTKLGNLVLSIGAITVISILWQLRKKALESTNTKLHLERIQERVFAPAQPNINDGQELEPIIGFDKFQKYYRNCWRALVFFYLAVILLDMANPFSSAFDPNEWKTKKGIDGKLDSTLCFIKTEPINAMHGVGLESLVDKIKIDTSKNKVEVWKLDATYLKTRPPKIDSTSVDTLFNEEKVKAKLQFALTELPMNMQYDTIKIQNIDTTVLLSLSTGSSHFANTKVVYRDSMIVDSVEMRNPVMRRMWATKMIKNYLQSKDKAKVTFAWACFSSFITTTLNNLAVYFIICCFIILYSYSRKDTKSTIDRLRQLVGFIIITLSVAHLLLIFYAFAHYKDLSAVNVVVTQVFPILSGSLNAFGMALLFGRFDSKLIGLRTEFVAMLLAYASIQALFLVLFAVKAEYKMLELIVLATALILKLYLLLISIRMIYYGGLLTYLWYFKTLDIRQDTIYSNQFEFIVHSHAGHHDKDEHDNTLAGDNSDDSAQLAYQIRHKGQIVFSYYGSTFRTLKEVIENVTLIQDSIKENTTQVVLNERSYFGTFLIELVINNRTVGHFKQFAMEHDRNEFKKDALRMLPYCKVQVQI